MFKNHEIIIKTILRWLPKVFALYCTIVSRNACFFTLHNMKTKFIGHIDNALLNIAMCYFCAESLLPWQQPFSYPEPFLRAVNGARQGALAKSISNWHLIGYNEGYCSNNVYIFYHVFMVSGFGFGQSPSSHRA